MELLEVFDLVAIMSCLIICLLSVFLWSFVLCLGGFYIQTNNFSLSSLSLHVPFLFFPVPELNFLIPTCKIKAECENKATH